MRHRKYTFKIGRSSAHRRAMMGNMVCSLIEEGRVKTTLAKGKQLRRFTDRMITLGKKGTLAARRRAVTFLNQKNAVQVLFDDLAAKMADRQGGYTRVLKLGQRQGDAAEMCLVELVVEPVAPKAKKASASEAAAPEVKAAPVEEAVVAEEVTAEAEEEEVAASEEEVEAASEEKVETDEEEEKNKSE